MKTNLTLYQITRGIYDFYHHIAISLEILTFPILLHFEFYFKKKKMFFTINSTILNQFSNVPLSQL